MKKKTATILTIAMLMFVPSTAKADLEIISGIQDLINVVVEKIDTVVKQYTSIQANLQELSLNRDIVSNLKDKVKSEMKNKATQFYGEVKDYAMAQGMMFLKTSLSSISLPGIGQYVDMGSFVNPKLTVAVGQTYLKRQHKKDDVKYISTVDKRSNDLMVDNLSVMFANALVRRVQLIEEDPCHCVDAQNNLISSIPNCKQDDANACKKKRDELSQMSDVNVIKEKYFETIMQGHQHWIKIQEAMSSYSKMTAESLMNQGNMDDVEDVIGVMDESLEEEEEDNSKEIEEFIKKKREENTLALANFTEGTIADIRSGNITQAFANVASGAANVYGNAPGSWQSVTEAMQNTAIGARTINNVYNNTQSGNWGGALGATVSGAGSFVGGVEGSAIGNAAGNSGAALNAALSGNWGDAIRNSSGAAGGVVGGNGNGVLGAAIGTAGSLTDVGIDAVNAGGNWNNYINNTIGSGQMQGALGNLENAYNQKAAQEAAELAEIRKQEEEARKAAEEAARKAAEEAEKKALEEKTEKMLEEQKEEAKKECLACRKANGKDAFVCSFSCGVAGL